MTLRKYLEDSLNWGEGESPTAVDVKKYFRCIFGLISTRTVFIFVKLFSCYEAIALMEEVIRREDVLHFMMKNEYEMDGYFWPVRRFADFLGGNIFTLCLLLLLIGNMVSLFSLASVEEVIPDTLKSISRRINPIGFFYMMIFSALYSGWCVFMVNVYEWETRKLEYVFLSKIILLIVKLLADFWMVSIDIQTVRYVLYLIKIREADQEANMYFHANDRRLLL